MIISGKIIQKEFAKGSKSASKAIYLKTKDAEYVLRKVGDNPFENKTLLPFIGKNVKAEGSLSEYLFLAKEVWEE
jgi:hypothetical protein